MASVQTLFEWFRNAGPLVSVQTGVNIGYPEGVISLEYWNEEHAKRACTLKNKVHPDLAYSPEFYLRNYDPYTVYCAVSGQSLGDLTCFFLSHRRYRCLARSSALSAFRTFRQYSARYLPPFSTPFYLHPANLRYSLVQSRSRQLALQPAQYGDSLL